MKCAVSGYESNNLVPTSINGSIYYVLPRFADLQQRLDFVSTSYVTRSGIDPSSVIFEFTKHVFSLVDSSNQRFADDHVAAKIFRIMLSEDLFDDDVQFYAIYTRWLEESGY